MYKWDYTGNTLCAGPLNSVSCMSPEFICAISGPPSFYCWVRSHCVHIPCFVYSSVNGHLGCFQLSILNKVYVNFADQVFLWTCVFFHLGYAAWVELLGQGVNVSLASDFPMRSVRASVIPPSRQHLALFLFLVIWGLQNSFLVVLICISLVTNDIGSLFMIFTHLLCLISWSVCFLLPFFEVGGFTLLLLICSSFPNGYVFSYLVFCLLPFNFPNSVIWWAFDKWDKTFFYS